jgi:hypothetical protein
VTCSIASSVALALVVLLNAPAWADEPSVTLSVGTGGVSASISRPVAAQTTLRLTYGTLQFKRSEQFDNVVIDVTARLRLNETFKIQNAGLYVERTLHGPFSIVGGVVDNLNHISAVSVPSDQSITIGGVVFPQATAGVIFTEIGWNHISPYIGFAYAPKTGARTSLYAEAGAYYQGKAHVDFNATGAILANQAKFQKYYDDERRQLTAQLAPVQLYPVIQLGVRVRL